MKELVVFEEYIDFISASRNAKEIAIRFNQETGIERKPNGWAVLVSKSVFRILNIKQKPENYEYEYERERSSYDDEYEAEVLRLWLHDNPGSNGSLLSDSYYGG